MTPEELQILKAISCSEDEVDLSCQRRSAAQAKAFDELVEVRQGMERLRWIELKAAEKQGRVGEYRRRYIAAVARCTEHGRQVLRMVGK